MKITECTHCGTPFTPKADEAYCCNGCYYVAQLIKHQGLERFYELKGDSVIPPVGSRVFESGDDEPLLTAFKAAEAAAGEHSPSLRLGMEGISCIGCVWLIEAVFKRQRGAGTILIDPGTGTIELSWQRGVFDLTEFSSELHSIGYRISPDTGNTANNLQGTRPLNHRIGLCGFFLLNTMLFTLPGYLGMETDFFLAPLFRLLSGLFATLSMFVGGGYFINRAWQAAKLRTLHIDLPIATGLIAAYIGSLIGFFSHYEDLIYFDFVATFVFLMLAGRWLQEYALEKNRSQLSRQTTGPREIILEDGTHLAATEVVEDCIYKVASGAINPVAADLLEAKGTLSLEWINGEPDPVTWTPKEIVPAGAINVGLHTLKLRARESWADGLLAKLMESNEATFDDRRLQSILRGYILAVLFIAFIGGISWLATTGNWLKAMQVLISILIVSCPCALGVALPLCNELAISSLRRVGLFLKSTLVWERLRSVNTVVFDKTGTLTMSIPRLKRPDAVRTLEPTAAHALYHLVATSHHPVARSLREALLAETPAMKKNKVAADTIKEVIGQGLLWDDGEAHCWSLGRPDWLAKDAAANPQARSVLRKDGYQIASFELIEDVREDARRCIELLRRRGMKTAILSGDAIERVHAIAAQLDIDSASIRARCSPTDKAAWIEQHAPGSALMIGDGANDRLAFEQAICRGTPVVDRSILDSATDFFFFGRSLKCLPTLFRVAKRRSQTVAVLFAFSVSYNIAAVSLCLAGIMHPLLAAILMPLSSIITLVICRMQLGRLQDD